MVAALVLPISGPYVGTWNGADLGTQNDDGFVLIGAYQGQEINLSDAYGMTLVEAIIEEPRRQEAVKSLIRKELIQFEDYLRKVVSHRPNSPVVSAEKK